MLKSSEIMEKNQKLFNRVYLSNMSNISVDSCGRREFSNYSKSISRLNGNCDIDRENAGCFSTFVSDNKESFERGNYLDVKNRHGAVDSDYNGKTNGSDRKVGLSAICGERVEITESLGKIDIDVENKESLEKLHGSANNPHLNICSYENEYMNNNPLPLTEGKFRRERLIPAYKGSIHTDYIIENQRIGTGTYGSVRCGKNRLTGCIRAIKTVPLKRVESPEIFLKEINILKNLDHPNIIKLFETYQDEENIYLVMELCTGGELFDRIMSCGSFDELYAAHMMKQVFSTICYCHDHGIVHRDLKPENFIFLNKKNTAPLKIIDFGLAVRINNEGTSLSTRAGTPYYVAPEVLQGNYDKQCDMWSLGVIMYILLCGYLPFNGSNDNIILHKIQNGFYSFNEKDWKHVSFLAIDLIRRLLTYNPNERATARDALNHPWITRFTKDVLPLPPRSYIYCGGCTRKYNSILFEEEDKVKNDTNTSNDGFVHSGLAQSTEFCRTEENPISSSCLNILSNFRAFHRYNRFMKIALTVIAQQMTESQISNLKETFILLDANCDGTLTPQEIITGLKNSGVNEFPSDLLAILNDIDSDGNGSIDYTEFIAATLDSKQYSKEHVYWAAFRVFDQDRNGKITASELLNLFCCNNDQVSTGFSEKAMNDIKNMIKEVDVNGDGEIDFQEFLEMFRKSVNIS